MSFGISERAGFLLQRIGVKNIMSDILKAFRLSNILNGDKITDILTGKDDENLLAKLGTSPGLSLSKLVVRNGSRDIEDGEDPHWLKRHVTSGTMYVTDTEWKVNAIWEDGNTPFKGEFHLKAGPAPSATLGIALFDSPDLVQLHVLNFGYKANTSAHFPHLLVIAGEIVVSYEDALKNVRTIRFTSKELNEL